MCNIKGYIVIVAYCSQISSQIGSHLWFLHNLDLDILFNTIDRILVPQNILFGIKIILVCVILRELCVIVFYISQNGRQIGGHLGFLNDLDLDTLFNDRNRILDPQNISFDTKIILICVILREIWAIFWLLGGHFEFCC